jgi:hydrogenase-4 component B
MHLPELLLPVSLVGFVAASAVGFLSRGRRGLRVSFLLGALAAALSAIQAVLVLGGGTMPASILRIPGTVSASPVLALGIQEDPLSAFFLLVVSVSASAILFASMGYAERYVPHRPGVLAGGCSLFVLTMVLVCTSGTVFFFLVAWEAMTLVSYFLVVHERESAESQSAGLVYLVMSHAATGAILVSFLLLATGTGSTTWAGIAAGAGGLSPGLRDAAFLAALVGFGTKAGMVPFHGWLPDAHPAAPSNVSALMSGVMIKMGIFGLLLVVLGLLGGGPSWWAYAILAFGGVSALAAVLYAIAQHDLKRLLAYHSIENIGIILLGVGTSLLFLDMGYPTLAALALAAALLHTWNHALFKSLLFLGAGAAVGETGSRDLNRMGGLIRRMPGVALGFLVGALAISALPPFNGFISEWLLFQSFFAGFSTGSVLAEMTLAALAAVLALTSGLAAYCFVKAFGITFLAKPRSKGAEQAGSPPASLVGGMGILGFLCLALGVAPILELDLAARPLRELTGAALGSGISLSLLSPLPNVSAGSLPLAPGWVALLLAGGLLVAWAVWRIRGTPKVVERPTWDGGLDAPTSRMEYTAAGYAQPVELLFSGFYRPTSRTERTESVHPSWADLAQVRHYSLEILDPIRAGLYTSIASGVVGIARRVSRLQSGRIHAYLAYIFVTLVGLLLLIRAIGGPAP